MKSHHILLFLCSALLVGCQTTGSDTGSGRIELSPGVQVHFEKYLASPEAEFFAVSPDGQAASYSFCPEAPCTFGNGVVALRSCKEQGHGACKIFASGKTIVWRGAQYKYP